MEVEQVQPAEVHQEGADREPFAGADKTSQGAGQGSQQAAGGRGRHVPDQCHHEEHEG